MSETKTRVWVTLNGTPEDPIMVADGAMSGIYPYDISRVFLDIPHGVGLGPEGPVDIVAEAVAAERERCAQICLEHAQLWERQNDWLEMSAACDCAAAIREGGE
jgi:hypothetical protein